jgi:hypothetical protein
MRGVGHVTVTFTDSGKVKAATVDSGPFTGTLMGACLASLFRNARVRPFTGPDVRVGKSFDVR